MTRVHLTIPYTSRWEALEELIAAHCGVQLVPNDWPTIDYFTVDVPEEHVAKARELIALCEDPDSVVKR
jgi:hypothetical protein